MVWVHVFIETPLEILVEIHVVFIETPLEILVLKLRIVIDAVVPRSNHLRDIIEW